MSDPANPNANKRRNAYLAMMKQLELEPHMVQIEEVDGSLKKLGAQVP